MSNFGFIDKSGDFVIPPQFDTCSFYADGVAAVEVDGKCGFIDKQGAFVIPLQFVEWAHWFSEGLAVVSINGKSGYISRDGSHHLSISNTDFIYYNIGA